MTMHYSEAVKKVWDGTPMRRRSWSERELFVYAQVPSEIPIERVPDMTSVPPKAKLRFENIGKDLCFVNQWVIAIDTPRGIAVTHYVPTNEDFVAHDWVVA